MIKLFCTFLPETFGKQPTFEILDTIFWKRILEISSVLSNRFLIQHILAHLSYTSGRKFFKNIQFLHGTNIMPIAPVYLLKVFSKNTYTEVFKKYTKYRLQFFDHIWYEIYGNKQQIVVKLEHQFFQP